MCVSRDLLYLLTSKYSLTAMPKASHFQTVEFAILGSVRSMLMEIVITQIRITLFEKDKTNMILMMSPIWHIMALLYLIYPTGLLGLLEGLI